MTILDANASRLFLRTVLTFFEFSKVYVFIHRLRVGWNTYIMRVRHAREVWYGAHISQPARTSKKHCDARCHRHLSPTSRQAEGDLRRRRSIARCRSQERRGSSAGECLAPAARKMGEAPWWARLKRLALFDPHPAPPNFLILTSPRGQSPMCYSGPTFRLRLGAP